MLIPTNSIVLFDYPNAGYKTNRRRLITTSDGDGWVDVKVEGVLADRLPPNFAGEIILPTGKLHIETYGEVTAGIRLEEAYELVTK